MAASTLLILAFMGGVPMVGFLWRLASRRHSLPCPVWLGWLVELENPLTRSSRASVTVARLSNVVRGQAGVGRGSLRPGQFDRAVLMTVLG